MSVSKSVGKLVRVSASGRAPPERSSPILIVVLRNEFVRLHDFLRHYRRLGVRRFAIIDNGSTDGGLELLMAQPDIDLYSCADTYSVSRRLAWLNTLIQHYGFDRWYLSVDADEHLVFEGSEEKSLESLVALMESRNIDRVLGLMIDMYAEGPVLDFAYETHGSLADAFPLFDGSGYRVVPQEGAPFILGGVRHRLFNRAHEDFDPLLTKFPLFKVVPGEKLAHAHYMSPYDKNFVSPRLLGLLHYKFLPDFLSRVNDAVARKIYFRDSFEQRCYQRILSENPATVMTGSPTRRFRTSADLLDAGVIAPIGWPGPAKEDKRHVQSDNLTAPNPNTQIGVRS